MAELTLKLSYLESELKELKKKKVPKAKVNDEVKGFKNTEDVLVIKRRVEEVVKKEEENSKDKNSSTPVKYDEKFLPCDQCDYRCNKYILLKKHTNTRHKKQKCRRSFLLQLS